MDKHRITVNVAGQAGTGKKSIAAWVVAKFTELGVECVNADTESAHPPLAPTFANVSVQVTTTQEPKPGRENICRVTRRADVYTLQVYKQGLLLTVYRGKIRNAAFCSELLDSIDWPGHTRTGPLAEILKS